MSDVSYARDDEVTTTEFRSLRREAEASIAVDDLPARVLGQDEYLFREGDPKRHVYRVEQGALCVTARGARGAPELVGLAYPGDLVGLGFLDTHIESAAAVTETKVSIWSRQALAVLCQASAEAATKQADTTEREFIYQRHRLVAATACSPLRRVAGFLLVVSRLNEIEGRSASVISENLRSGEVSAFLGMDLETLACQLVELQRQALISLTARGGLRLEKPAELQGLVDLSA